MDETQNRPLQISFDSSLLDFQAPRPSLGISASILVGNLPVCNQGLVGTSYNITDCQTCTFGGTCTGGGSTFCPETCSGTQWLAVGGRGGLAPVPVVATPTTVSVAAPTTLVLPAVPLNAIQTITMNATAAITIPQGSFAGQAVAIMVCQNSVGGALPNFVPITGLTLIGTFPSFTTAANTCGAFDLIYTTPTNVFLVGTQAGPL